MKIENPLDFCLDKLFRPETVHVGQGLTPAWNQDIAKTRNSSERNEMLRSKLGLLGLCVLAVGMMAFSAASAQGAVNWLILEKNEVTVHTGGELNAELVGEIDSKTVSLLTKLVKLKIEVRCTAFTLVGVKLEAAGALTNGGKAKFTGCEVYNAATGILVPECEVKTAGLAWGEVESLKAKGQLQTNGETRIDPSTGVIFAELLFGPGCVLPSPTTVNGVLFLEDCEKMPELHLVKHLIKQGTGTSLYVGADTAEHLETSIDGSGWVFLAGNEKGKEHEGLKWGAVFP